VSNAIKPGSGSAKARWALIHRVPVFPLGGSGTMSHGKITWKRVPGVWVKVGSPRWNRIMAASHKTGAGITPTAYKVSAVNPSRDKSLIPVKGAGNEVGGRNSTNPKAPGQTRGRVQNPIGNQKGAGSGSVARKGSGVRADTGGPRRSRGSGGGGFRAIGQKIGNPNIGNSIPRSLAKQLAALQFQPQINQTKQNIAQQQLQGAQDLKDISDWYGQAIQMQNQAGTADQAAAAQAASANQNAATAILNAIGGGANQGAGQVANTGAAGVAAANLLGTIDQTYHNNMVPALQTQLAGASSAQKALNGQAVSHLQDALNTLLQQRGSAHAQAIMNIIQANNSLSQQRFANRLSKLQAQDALIQLMGNQAVQRSEIAGNNAKTRAIRAQSAAAGGSVHPKFSSLGPGDQLKLLQAWAINPANQLRSYQQALGLANAQGYTSNFAHNALLKYITGAAPTK
jgi:hypothetical protein